MSEHESIVFVVDDDPSVRRSLERLFRAAGLNVRTFASGREFLQIVPPEIPACLILDLRLPGLSGLEVQQELFNLGILIPIIFITAYGDVPTTVKAMKAGAVEFLRKPLSNRRLLDAARLALEQDEKTYRERAEDAELRRRYEQLTAREREVMAHVVAGKLNKQVAADLATTVQTIKFHRARIMRKMQADCFPSLVRMAERLSQSARNRRQTE